VAFEIMTRIAGPASIERLNYRRSGPIPSAMARRFAHRLRALSLIIALAFALVGQGFAPVAMAMQPQDASMTGMSATSGMSTAPSEICLGCKGMDHSKAMRFDCAIGVCSAVVGVLPSFELADVQPLSSFASVAQEAGHGITIPPPLGPPRPLHLT
jgi:hypothetical protein